MRRWLVLGVTMLWVLGAVHAAAGSDASTIVNANLTSGPATDASVVSAVPTGTAITVIERQGGWYHVRLASGQDGWLPMTSIKYNGGGTASAGSTNWSSLFESGRSGAGGTTASTGVRGLNTGDIANAVPDPAAVKELDKWVMKPDDATKFAQQLPLKAVKVDYLPEVKP